MSDEQLTLPDPIQYDDPFTWDVPNILTELKDGRATIRFGGAMQLAMTTRVEYSETEVSSEPLFRIRSTNVLGFWGSTGVPIINDAVEEGRKLLPASEPTASEYLEAIGKPVLHHFLCEPDHQASERLQRKVWRIARSTFILP